MFVSVSFSKRKRVSIIETVSFSKRKRVSIIETVNFSKRVSIIKTIWMEDSICWWKWVVSILFHVSTALQQLLYKYECVSPTLYL